jgi:hypothetical protein
LLRGNRHALRLAQRTAEADQDSETEEESV